VIALTGGGGPRPGLADRRSSRPRLSFCRARPPANRSRSRPGTPIAFSGPAAAALTTRRLTLSPPGA